MAKEGLNPKTYVHNNPRNFKDRTAHGKEYDRPFKGTHLKLNNLPTSYITSDITDDTHSFATIEREKIERLYQTSENPPIADYIDFIQLNLIGKRLKDLSYLNSHGIPVLDSESHFKYSQEYGWGFITEKSNILSFKKDDSLNANNIKQIREIQQILAEKEIALSFLMFSRASRGGTIKLFDPIVVKKEDLKEKRNGRLLIDKEDGQEEVNVVYKDRSPPTKATLTKEEQKYHYCPYIGYIMNKSKSFYEYSYSDLLERNSDTIDFLLETKSAL